MVGLLILTIVCILKASNCIEYQILKNETDAKKESNDTGSAETEMYYREIPPLAITPSTRKYAMSPREKECSCPCKGSSRVPVCGKTTNGLFKIFESHCHLICHNQCDFPQKYAITFHDECTVTSLANRKNVFSHWADNRRTDFIPGYIEEFRNPEQSFDWFPSSTSETAATYRIQPFVTPTISLSPPSKYPTVGIYESFITPLESTNCDCAHCPLSKWIRTDYYPICAEKDGQRKSFESWCHFDCENKCVKRAGSSSFLYIHKGECAVESRREIVAPRTFESIMKSNPCSLCIPFCKEYFEPVCAKNGKNEYLSFKSRCHMQCHNLCLRKEIRENFNPAYDGHCFWL